MRYYAVSNGKDTNFYRLRIEGRSDKGRAEFRNGWFPSEVVDALFGDADVESAATVSETRDAIQLKINKAKINAWEEWLKVVSNAESTEEEIVKQAKALQYLRTRPSAESKHFGELAAEAGLTIMSYDPEGDLETRLDSKKEVIAFSSDPDQVMQQIAVVSNEVESVSLVKKLAALAGTQSNPELVRVYSELDEIEGSENEIRALIDSIQDKSSKLRELLVQYRDDLSGTSITADNLTDSRSRLGSLKEMSFALKQELAVLRAYIDATNAQ
ncbi:hypothetical protein QEH56_04840 [Pelagicoccus enzymogenes]|uniref:hypothetical protein n=1 Tax=Pelagicoccus enzymogenes TaxID=2773457 RepID=UPI0028106F0A|nr:hypothetical protein [Pelagicoccus enzymogenes]MDQ8197461.1 hypothetical protein [Pelagicoccus enzymogenes]